MDESILVKFDGSVAPARHILVCTSTKIHRTQYDFPCEIETIPEFGIMYAESDRVAPNSGNILGDIGKRAHSGR